VNIISGDFVAQVGRADVGFEVLTAVVMKISIFWDITPCTPLKVNRRFGGTNCLHLQGRRINQVRNPREAGSKKSNLYLENLSFYMKLRTTRSYTPEDGTLHNHRCENFKFFVSEVFHHPPQFL
jgi:hypothetical protein